DTDPADKDRLRPLNPANPAYITYTSGSTGRPKGVLGLHDSGVNRLAWFGGDHPWDACKPVLARASLNFIDGSTELLGGLLHGSEVCLASSEDAKDPQKLAALIQGYKIDRLTVVPSLLNAFLKLNAPNSLSSCNHWITSGERLQKDLVAEFRQAAPNQHLYNFYGSSEAAGDSVFIECLQEDLPPIGHPIWNTQVYVLDDHLCPVPAGVGGELYIAG
ncbi:amino acid adenylation domain-containing protein, partial [Agrobacterium rhizogenes]|nr:amino acid adenylation domain-containing protein [Rhizobium rhizogenes]NTI00392.1 amino acid adenylation domain-containing protein [Rhizobium rhizogenes]NTJ18628.1 amino acid adenylation domain-containing protein [Rhizobium rhizogenes]